MVGFTMERMPVDKPWGGVFDQATDRRVEKFTQSVSFDQRLSAHDIRGSIAHAHMLSKVGILTDDERHQIVTGLEAIGREIAAGRFEFRQELEDVHMNIERALVERIGDVGRKLHTGRSRNDQVSTDLRLWVRDQIDAISARLRACSGHLSAGPRRDAGVILPGYTHLQRAQPVLAAHYWLAYCEKLERDRDRLADCRLRVNQLPLGTAALAGTTIPIDRQMVADELGFDGILANSLDSSSDRDFVLEFAFCLADDRRAPQRLGRGMDPVVDHRVRLSAAAAAVLHRLVDHAAENQPGRAGADSRQIGTRDRQSHEPVGAREGFAAGLQPRPAGGQGAAVRFGRYGGGVPGAGRTDRGRRGAEPRSDRSAPRPRVPGCHDADGTPDQERRAAALGPRNHRPARGNCDETWRAARRVAAR